MNVTEELEEQLPSYQEATLRSPWPYILPYVQRRDLLSLCQVNERLRGTVQSFLWKHPSISFPKDESDALSKINNLFQSVTLFLSVMSVDFCFIQIHLSLCLI